MNFHKFHEFWVEDQKKKVFIVKYAQNSTNSANSRVKTKKRKKSLHCKMCAKFHKFHELWGEDQNQKKVFIAKSAKKQILLTDSGVMTSILGADARLELHSYSAEPVTFFKAQFSFGGTSSDLAGTATKCPPMAPGLTSPLQYFF